MIFNTADELCRAIRDALRLANEPRCGALRQQAAARLPALGGRPSNVARTWADVARSVGISAERWLTGLSAEKSGKDSKLFGSRRIVRNATIV